MQSEIIAGDEKQARQGGRAALRTRQADTVGTATEQIGERAAAWTAA